MAAEPEEAFVPQWEECRRTEYGLFLQDGSGYESQGSQEQTASAPKKRSCNEPGHGKAALAAPDCPSKGGAGGYGEMGGRSSLSDDSGRTP